MTLYAVMDRDAMDFFDMLPEASEGALKTLYLMLTTPNPDMTERNRTLNAAMAPVLAGHMESRKIAVPEPVKLSEPKPAVGAWTATEYTGHYPPYVNVTRKGESVTVTVRSPCSDNGSEGACASAEMAASEFDRMVREAQRRG